MMVRSGDGLKFGQPPAQSTPRGPDQDCTERYWLGRDLQTSHSAHLLETCVEDTESLIEALFGSICGMLVLDSRI